MINKYSVKLARQKVIKRYITDLLILGLAKSWLVLKVSLLIGICLYLY